MDTGSTDYLIKGNAGQYGFYRVNYDDAGWGKMIKVLKYNHKVFGINSAAANAKTPKRWTTKQSKNKLSPSLMDNSRKKVHTPMFWRCDEGGQS